MITTIGLRKRITKIVVSILVMLIGSTHANANGYFLDATGFDNTIIVEHNSRLWIQFGDASEAQRLTNSSVEEVTPAVSPDNAFVAYVADAGAHLEVFITEIGTGAAERLTFEAGYNVEIQGWLNETEILFSSVGVGGKTRARCSFQLTGTPRSHAFCLYLRPQKAACFETTSFLLRTSPSWTTSSSMRVVTHSKYIRYRRTLFRIPKLIGTFPQHRASFHHVMTV